MTNPNDERRQVPRVPALGGIKITLRNPHSLTLEARLVDTTSHGFRIIHDSKEMMPGLEVQFQRETASGRARVIWTHILGDHRESGFLVLDSLRETSPAG